RRGWPTSWSEIVNSVCKKVNRNSPGLAPVGSAPPTPSDSCGTSSGPLGARVGLGGCARLAEDQLGGRPAPAGHDRLLPVAARERERLVARDPEHQQARLGGPLARVAEARAAQERAPGREQLGLE